MRRYLALAILVAALPIWSRADDPSSPRPIPLTRPEMKKYIENMKARQPRIPLPELTAEEKEKLGERGGGYEGRVRSLYAPGTSNANGNAPRPADGARPAEGTRPAGSGRENEPGMTLDYKFKTELFWIVSRTNNCQYCLGHQEGKLLGAGMVEDEIACLDGDWSEFTPAEQAAFRLARRLTLAPHRLTDSDIEDVRKHFTDLQILEMVLSVAGNNSINRWKEGVGVPQSAGGGNFGRRPAAEGTTEAKPEAHSYLTPTSEKYATKVTVVAPIIKDNVASALVSATVAKRPALESRDEVERSLTLCSVRKPRLPLVDEAKAREVLEDNAPEGTLPAWMRLVANFPQSGKRLVATIRNANEKGDLSPLLKAQAAWIIARQDRAWYATAEAKQRLEKLGQSVDQIYALDGKWDDFSPREQALFTIARNLAASPVVLTDAQVAQALELAGPRDVVQMITYTTSRASFDRITEAAGLASEK
jgi:alkylhydroperoxidase family enzyme